MLRPELLGNQGQQALPREEALRENRKVWWYIGGDHMSSKSLCDTPLHLMMNRNPYNGPF